jgi:(p)ppGpp synthase/HD superfamily hydrolase
MQTNYDPKVPTEHIVPQLEGTLANAISLSARLFESKEFNDKSGQPYILHKLAVYNNSLRFDDEELSIGCILHDVVEDTYYTLQMLRDEGYSERVVKIVDGLTRRIGETYENFIDRILNDQDCIKAKMCDIEHNSLILRLKGVRQKDLDRIVKYNKAYYILKEHLEH